jgi:hypothetical protein
MVVMVSIGLKPRGDCVKGSGEVPHDELGPAFELEEADGELVAPPSEYCAESRLALDALPAELVMDGVKMPENLARSSLN